MNQSKLCIKAIVFLLFSSHTAAIEYLPELNIQSNKVTVSGISSGGYMAQQLHIAYSAKYSAAGIIAGGPFYCAENSLALALTRCIKPNDVNNPDSEALIELTHFFDSQSYIDSVGNLEKDRVWIFSSPDDTVVFQRVGDSLNDYYNAFTDVKNIKYINNIRGEHSMPTDDFGYPCDYLGASSNPEDHFINNCGYDAAGELLTFLYQTIKRPKSQKLSGEIIKFNQEDFIPDPNAHGLAQYGYAYIPESCSIADNGKSKKCKLHVALHGCLQSADRIGSTFIENAGYNDWADSNQIVVLYPQATASVEQGNGNGCWDWWGYDSNDYATKFGNQMQAIDNMVNRISAQTSKNNLSRPLLSVNSDLLGTISLSWTEIENAIGYEIYSSDVSGGPYYEISLGIVESNTLSLLQDPSEQRYYVVVALAADGEESLPSRELAAAVPRLY